MLGTGNSYKQFLAAMRPIANVVSSCQGSYKNDFGNFNLILLWAGSYTCVVINGESGTQDACLSMWVDG